MLSHPKTIIPTALVAFAGFGCNQGPAKCDEAACKPICEKMAPKPSAPTTKTPPPPPAASAGGGDLTAFEKQVVDPILEDVRQGIRPFGDDAIGICKGTGKECEEFLGTEVGELPEGEYMLRAELRVPKSGENWKVRLETDCETTTETKSGESKTSRTSSKEYDVRYVGDEHGYRLSPLYKITSPNERSQQTCKWKLVMLHPDGDKTVEGSWTVPAKPEE